MVQLGRGYDTGGDREPAATGTHNSPCHGRGGGNLCNHADQLSFKLLVVWAIVVYLLDLRTSWVWCVPRRERTVDSVRRCQG